MKIPKYIQEIMSRSEFDLEYRNPSSMPGYTIRVHKATPYTRAATLRDECRRMLAWADRHYAYTELLMCPSDTHYHDQYALVTVTDPCMLYMEQYMKNA